PGHHGDLRRAVPGAAGARAGGGGALHRHRLPAGLRGGRGPARGAAGGAGHRPGGRPGRVLIRFRTAMVVTPRVSRGQTRAVRAIAPPRGQSPSLTVPPASTAKVRGGGGGTARRSAIRSRRSAGAPPVPGAPAPCRRASAT